MGPNICYLCFKGEETISQLLVHCQFTQDVWNELKKVYNFDLCWNFIDLLSCFKNIMEKDNGWKEILFCFCCEIWTHRNHILFENTQKSIFKVISNICSKYKEWHKDKPQSSTRIIWRPLIDNLILVGYFDGSAQEDGCKCGAGATMHIDKDQFFQAKQNYGRGTNNRGELLALWMLLWITQLYTITNLQVLWDSRAIIDWETNKHCLQSLVLEPYKNKVKELLVGFLQVDMHTWREFNQDANLLSKQTLQLEEGKISLTFLRNRNMVFNHFFSLF